MKGRWFTKTFFHFFVGFLIIIAAAFGVMLYAGSQVHQVPTVDNYAVPQ